MTQPIPPRKLISRRFVEIIISILFFATLAFVAYTIINAIGDDNIDMAIMIGIGSLLGMSVFLCFLIIGVLKVHELEKLNAHFNQSEKHAEPEAPQMPTGPAATLAMLENLRRKNILSQEEFEAKRKEVLKQM